MKSRLKFKKLITTTAVAMMAFVAMTSSAFAAPTLLSNQSSVKRSPSFSLTGTASLSGYLFYSQSPETIDATDLADAGKWLNKNAVSGSGQVYTWHNNAAGATITNHILIYNPSSTDTIVVTSSNYGTSNNTDTDSLAWKDYLTYGRAAKTVEIGPGNYGSLFSQSIVSGANFGIVARTNVTKKGTSTAASAIFYDIAYKDPAKSGNASAYATADPSSSLRKRGLGNGYYTTLRLPVISPTESTNGIAFKFGATGDSFNGADMPYITDDAPSTAGNTSGNVAGSYGQQFDISFVVQNTTSVARSFRVYAGSIGGTSYPFTYMGGNMSYYPTYSSGAPGFYFKDIIDTGVLQPGASTTVSFFYTVPAMSSAPNVIGVRAN
ncbi:hypothetical protein ACFFSY_24865 [Paenibacillus aurantiacus]|uniref:Uncharacterized protein n=1 Tax=Paenibacillus aurantiacus TaxID=1936118 RepID=A0ABV5KVE0_9BACL